LSNTGVIFGEPIFIYMAPLSNMVETGIQEMPTTTKLPSFSSSSNSISEKTSTNGLKKQRLQHYIRKLKKAIINYDSSRDFNDPTNSTSKKHLSTFEVLERAIQLISDSHSSNQWLKPSTPNEHNQMPIITSQPSSDESAPSSPAASSTSTSSTSIDQQRHNDRQQQSQSPSSQTLLSNTSAITSPTTSDRLWGTVSLSLPDGIITNLWSSNNNNNNDDNRDLPNFTNILKKDLNLLELLQGKGAQTLLLNAFCGSSKRRMYARLKCGGKLIRPFEFICEFTPNPSNPSCCSAQIQILCLESAFKKSSNFSSPTIFTTRHNSSCALIYLDAASIPYLGHFPSEITGKSLFTFIHSDDVSIIQYAHQQLHANNGRLVSTPNLRLVSYNGTVIPVSSEWSAFVNPWTKTIEMIVGRHCINHEASAANALSSSETAANEISAIIQPEKFRELDLSIHSFISRPIVSDEIITPTTIIGEKVIKQELQDEQPVVLQTQPQQHQNLRSYIDNVVENLVISQEEKQQVEEEIKTLQEGTPILSYNQINCLENVHRLLKSQSKFLEFDTKEKENNSNNSSNVETTAKPSTTTNITLTRELLQQHNRKWESQCKDTWKKRLNMKRIAASGNAEEKQQQPPTKTPRIRSEPQAYSISTTPLPPTSRVISSQYHPSSTPSATTTTNNFLPPLPYPPPTPLDQQAWTEYVKLVQLHLQNMATIDQQQQQQSNKRITSLQQYHHHQQQKRVQHERQLAALAMTFQQVQIPPHHHHSHSHQQQPSGASSPFNALPSLN
jgi:hypothetical protein